MQKYLFSPEMKEKSHRARRNIHDKVEAIKNKVVPITIKQSKKFYRIDE